MKQDILELKNLVIDIDLISEEGVRFHITKPGDLLHVEDRFFELSGSFDLTGRVRKAEKNILFDGEVKAEGALTCSRCVKKYKKSFCVPINTSFLPEPDDSGEEKEIDNEGDMYFYEGKEINILLPVRDQIALQVPMKTLCSDN